MFDRSSINQVTDVHADTRKNFKPQHRSLLFNLQRKDPVEQENNGEVGLLSIFTGNFLLSCITWCSLCSYLNIWTILTINFRYRDRDTWSRKQHLSFLENPAWKVSRALSKKPDMSADMSGFLETAVSRTLMLRYRILYAHEICELWASTFFFFFFW